jgi:threonine dehydratase
MNLLSRLIEHDMAERGRLLRVRVALPDQPGVLASITNIIATHGANVLQVMHDRFYPKLPGHVEITVVMEVRDHEHAHFVTEQLRRAGVIAEIV